MGVLQITLFLISTFPAFGVKLTPPPSVIIFELSICLRFEQVPDDAFVPYGNSKTYQDLNYQWNTVNYIEPLAYIVPTKTAHVQGAIKCGRKLGIPMVAKSGGHHYVKYSFGNSSAVIIDFVKMADITVDKKRSEITVGPGALVAHFQYHAWQNGFVLPMPLCISVGIGGATLGGGFGYLSKKFGLMSDNVLEMEMVTADSNVLKINSYQNKDLFWALRGGAGGNFGFVTKYKFKTYDAANLKFTYISLTYATDQFVQVFNASQYLTLENAAKSVFIFGRYSNTNLVMTIIDVNLSTEDANSIIQKLPPPKTKSITIYPDYVNIVLLDSVSVRVQNPNDLKNVTRLDVSKRYTKTKTYFVKKVVPTDEISKLYEVARNIPNGSNFGWQSFGGIINKVAKDATAFVHRDALYYIEVKIGSNDSKTVAWVNDFNRAVTPLDDGESYQNIQDGTLPNYLDRYYATNLRRLRQIKRIVDPANYFNFPQSIPPI